MQRRLIAILLLALFTVACGRAPAGSVAPSYPPPPVDIAYIGPIGGAADAFRLAIARASRPPDAHFQPVVVTAGCGGRSEQEAALAAGANPAIVAAVLADCPGGATRSAVAELRQLQLPAIQWGDGLQAVTWLGTSVQRTSDALPAAVARFDRSLGLTDIACLAAASFCSALAAAGLRLVYRTAGSANPAALAATRPQAIWSSAAPAAAAALRRQLEAERLSAPLEGSGLRAGPYLAAAGAGAAGTLDFSLVQPGAATAQLAQLQARFAAAGYRSPLGPTGPEAYAATQWLLATAERVGPRRSALAGALRGPSPAVPTVLGSVAFDGSGGQRQPTVSISVAAAGAWHPWSSAPRTVSGSVYGG